MIPEAEPVAGTSAALVGWALTVEIVTAEARRCDLCLVSRDVAGRRLHLVKRIIVTGLRCWHRGQIDLLIAIVLWHSPQLGGIAHIRVDLITWHIDLKGNLILLTGKQLDFNAVRQRNSVLGIETVFAGFDGCQ